MKAPDIGKKLPPGPPAYSLIGNLRALSKDPVEFFTRCSKQYGDFVYLKLLNVPICLFTNPREVEYVLITNASNFVKSPDIRVIRMVLGNGMLTTEGSPWQKERRWAQPAFRHDNLATYGEIAVHQATETLDKWRDGEMIDLHQQMMVLTLDVVARSLLGFDFEERSRAIGNALRILMGQFVSLSTLAFMLPHNFPLPRTRRFKRTLSQLDEILSEAIRSRRFNRGASNDLLEMYLRIQDENGGEMTDAHLIDEVKTIFVTGHETTANALSWSLYLLAQHPDVEAKLHQELSQTLGSRPPVVTDLSRLPYTEMVVKEALRLYPALAMIGRQAVGDFEVGGYHFPAGMNVGLMTLNTHKDSRFFTEPERFHPDRWNIDLRRGNPIPRLAYYPFGAGARTCIGAGFAMMETTLILATITQRCRFVLAPNRKMKMLPALTLRPENGIFMVVQKS